MLKINLILDIESTFTGHIEVFTNTGGVRGVKIGERYLKIIKDDSYKPDRLYISQNLISRPKSE